MADRDSAAPLASVTSDSVGEIVNGAAFEADEWRVIALARLEAAKGQREPSPLGLKLARWFGFHISTALANPRLEALRLFVLRLIQSGGRPPTVEIERFLAAGFSTFQARALVQRAASLSTR